MIDQIRSDVARLATARGRMVGTAGHEAARAYLLHRMAEMGLAPYAGAGFDLVYEDSGVQLANLVGRLPGTAPELAPVLLAAHYDTCGPFPGADDNAAAIAILLSLVGALRARKIERTVLFAFFDGEEPPYFLSPGMGSSVFYDRQREEPIHCAIVLDLVGHDVPVPGLGELLFVTGMESDPELAEVLLGRPEVDGLRLVATLNRYIGDLSDHHAFRLARRPYLFLSCGQWEHYHQPTDTPERLNYAKVAAVADWLVALVPAVGRRSLTGPFEGYDSTPAELHFLQNALGELAAQLGVRLRGRSDIETLVGRMLYQFGLLPL